MTSAIRLDMPSPGPPGRRKLPIHRIDEIAVKARLQIDVQPLDERTLRRRGGEMQETRGSPGPKYGEWGMTLNAVGSSPSASHF